MKNYIEGNIMILQRKARLYCLTLLVVAVSITGHSFAAKSNAAGWGSLREHYPNGDAVKGPNEGVERTVFVHVVPWHQPHGKKNVPDCVDPTRNHFTLAVDETNEQKRVDVHLLRMRNAGIDVVALDVMIRAGWNSGSNPDQVLWQGSQARRWLDAMKRLAPEMRFCLQMDRHGGQKLSVENWVPALKVIESTFAQHPNYYHKDGKPVLLSFWLNEDVSDALLGEICKQIESRFYFVGSVVENPGKELGPLTRSVINHYRVNEAVKMFDAIDICPLGSHISWLENSYVAITPMLRKADKPLYWGVSTGYYRRGVAFIEPAYNYLNTLWMKAINNNVENVIIWTWNDVKEDHDIAPSTIKGDALLNLMALYIQWYKTGEFPILQQNRIFISYPISNGDRRAKGGGEQPTWPNLNYFIWSVKAGEFEIPEIGKVKLQAGLNVGQLGKTIPGTPGRFTLKRGENMVKFGEISNPMINATSDAKENMKYYWKEL
jgi:hypothetical protein